MRYSLVSSIALFVVLACSCGTRVIKGEGSIITEARSVGKISMIEISAPVIANVHLRAGVPPTVTLTGYKNVLSEIKTDRDGNTFRITHRKFVSFNGDEKVVAEITVAALSDLRIQGAAEAIIDGSITGSDFKIKISGAGDVTVDRLDVSNLTSVISGAGDLYIKNGSADNVHFKISGAGSINSYGLQANNVKAKVSGAGDVFVTALRTLDAKISGAGSIHYKGHPSLMSEASGVGEIVAVD